MPTYPGDPQPEIERTNDITKAGYTDYVVKTNMHVGTHMDAPLHMIENGKKLTEYPANHFVGRGVLLDVRGKMKIDADLLNSVDIQKGDIVLLLTGMDKKYRQSEYFENYPEVSEAFAKELVKRGAKILGLDSCSPDKPQYPTHKILLGADVLIIENLTNLDQLVGRKDFEVIALPVNYDVEAAPARVVARV